MVQKSSPEIITIPTIRGPLPGALSFLEAESTCPFPIRRIYWIHGVPMGQVRGFHAHHKLQQVLFASGGRVEIETEDLSGNRRTFFLESPDEGLYVPPVHWRTIKFLNEHSTLICAASELYQESDYIRDYEVFQKLQAPYRGGRPS